MRPPEPVAHAPDLGCSCRRLRRALQTWASTVLVASSAGGDTSPIGTCRPIAQSSRLAVLQGLEEPAPEPPRAVPAAAAAVPGGPARQQRQEGKLKRKAGLR
eukprot:SM000228S07395  [mRNA]  locus=s228:214452:214804:+ [translate_table: standard]